jgi:hypothetical protein
MVSYIVVQKHLDCSPGVSLLLLSVESLWCFCLFVCFLSSFRSVPLCCACDLLCNYFYFLSVLCLFCVGPGLVSVVVSC